jgi:uncharacterized protein (TIGR02145 family)
MARISTYEIDPYISLNDIILGTDGDPGMGMATKNFSMEDLAKFIMQYVEDNSSCCGSVTSLTTTETTGPSTLIDGVLNVPNYDTTGNTHVVIKYGYLYNWFAAGDSRNIASTGWSVPSIANMITLRDYLDPINTTDPAYYTNTAGGKMKETGLTYWNTPNTNADNAALFNGRGSGIRSSSGEFNSVKVSATFWSSSVYVTPNISTGILRFDDNIFYTAANITNSKPEGLSIRLVKEATTLTNGQTGTYVGNDGKIYRTICIGTQEWLADNLKETKYRNLDAIPEVIPNATWAALSAGARCSYGNAESSFLTLSTTSVISNWSPTVVTNTGSTLTWDVTGDITPTSQNVNDPTFNLTANIGTVTMNIYDIRLVTILDFGNSSGITLLNSSNLDSLLSLRVIDSYLTNLDLTNNTSLQELFITNNSLTTLSLTTQASLIALDCENNNLVSLDVSPTNIKILRCEGNSFTSTVTNKILTDLVAIGQNNGTLNYRNNETGQGVTDRATLISRGWSITNYTT